MNPLVTVSHLRKSYAATPVLEDVSFTLRKGQLLSILGPSGSGKSTLLRCLTRLEEINAGTITIDGDDLVRDGVYASKNATRHITRKLGYVFQDFNLFPHFSVLRNITEAQIHVLRRTRDQARERALTLLGKMGLAHKAAAYPCELSIGQRQRVAIARALALDPQVLLFDEPTSALDPELTGEVLHTLRQLAEDRITMILVTHEIAFAEQISDHALFMDAGRIVETGNIADMLHAPQNARTEAFFRNCALKH